MANINITNEPNQLVKSIATAIAGRGDQRHRNAAAQHGVASQQAMMAQQTGARAVAQGNDFVNTLMQQNLQRQFALTQQQTQHDHAVAMQNTAHQNSIAYLGEQTDQVIARHDYEAIGMRPEEFQSAYQQHVASNPVSFKSIPEFRNDLYAQAQQQKIEMAKKANGEVFGLPDVDQAYNDQLDQKIHVLRSGQDFGTGGFAYSPQQQEQAVQILEGTRRQPRWHKPANPTPPHIQQVIEQGGAVEVRPGAWKTLDSKGTVRMQFQPGAPVGTEKPQLTPEQMQADYLSTTVKDPETGQRLQKNKAGEWEPVDSKSSSGGGLSDEKLFQMWMTASQANPEDPAKATAAFQSGLMAVQQAKQMLSGKGDAGGGGMDPAWAEALQLALPQPAATQSLTPQQIIPTVIQSLEGQSGALDPRKIAPEALELITQIPPEALAAIEQAKGFEPGALSTLSEAIQRSGLPPVVVEDEPSTEPIKQPRKKATLDDAYSRPWQQSVANYHSNYLKAGDKQKTSAAVPAPKSAESPAPRGLANDDPIIERVRERAKGKGDNAEAARAWLKAKGY